MTAKSLDFTFGPSLSLASTNLTLHPVLSTLRLQGSYLLLSLKQVSKLQNYFPICDRSADYRLTPLGLSNPYLKEQYVRNLKQICQSACLWSPCIRSNGQKEEEKSLTVKTESCSRRLFCLCIQVAQKLCHLSSNGQSHSCKNKCSDAVNN